MNNMIQRLHNIWPSYRSLPLWVQVWVGLILVPVNTLPFLFLPQDWAIWGSLAALFVVVTNVPIMWFEQGMSRLMSIPHLFAWIPLHIVLILTLLSETTLTPTAHTVIWLLLIVNSISLLFDLVDSWRWLNGERDVPRPTPTR